MKLTDFKFETDDLNIPEEPLKRRDSAKLMVLNRAERTIEHTTFDKIHEYLNKDDIMIYNNTKVFPARLNGKKEKTEADIEVFLLRELMPENMLWDVLVEPARKIRIGNKLYFGENDELVAEVIDNTTSRGRTLRFLFDGNYDEFKETLTKLGQTPIPKYLEREAEAIDDERYQTIFSKNEGAVAVPTAGLHFSRELMKRLELKGINFAEVTLHVGLGTFRPVEVEDLTKHKMDSEQMIIDQKAADTVNWSKDNRGKICVIGTTAMRAVETSVSTDSRLTPYKGWTNRFIFPPYDFEIADAMISNFHAPESTLLMQVAAFGGYDFMMKAYKEAIKKKYRFLAYGDAMLIL
jgi:S-adenosylmethionine:tRNA ribosyltransferase-isomerase